MASPTEPAPGGRLKDYGDMTPSKEHSPKVFSPAKRCHADFAGKLSDSDEDSLGATASLTFKRFKTTGEESPPVVEDSPTIKKVDSHDGEMCKSHADVQEADADADADDDDGGSGDDEKFSIDIEQ
jgi:hypothetical protein